MPDVAELEVGGTAVVVGLSIVLAQVQGGIEVLDGFIELSKRIVNESAVEASFGIAGLAGDRLVHQLQGAFCLSLVHRLSGLAEQLRRTRTLRCRNLCKTDGQDR